MKKLDLKMMYTLVKLNNINVKIKYLENFITIITDNIIIACLKI